MKMFRKEALLLLLCCGFFLTQPSTSFTTIITRRQKQQIQQQKQQKKQESHLSLSFQHVNAELNTADTTEECLRVFQQYFPHTVDTISFGILLKAYAREGKAVDAEQLLNDQIDLWEHTKDAHLQPDRISFTTVMDAWTKSGTPDAVDRALVLLKRLEQLAKTTNNVNQAPDVVTWTCAISACRDPKQAQIMLEQLWDRYNNGNSSIKPNVRTYVTVIHCWANARSKEAALQADELVRSMREKFEAGDSDMEPNIYIYNTVLNAWSKSGAYDAPERIEGWLGVMEAVSNHENKTSMVLDSASFNIAITTWAKSGRPEAVERVEYLIDRMFDTNEVDPDIVTYSCLMALYARTKQAQKATDLLYRVCDAYTNGISKVPPNSVVFASVLSAWSKSNDPNAVQNAEAVINRMKQMQVPPTTPVYNALISAWGSSKHPAALEKTLEYFAEMKDKESCVPNLITYTAVLKVLSTNKDTKAAVVKAYKILNEIRASIFEPDLIIYSTILNVLSKCNERDSLSKAFLIMDEIKSSNTQPNRICYNCLIKCISRSRAKDKAQKALDIVNEMERAGVEPDIITWNEVLAACAYSDKYDTSSRKRAFQVADHVLLRINKPSSHSYSHFFQAAVGLNREESVEQAYLKCRELGFAQDKFVVRNIRRAAPHLVGLNQLI